MIKLNRFSIDSRYASGPKIIFENENDTSFTQQNSIIWSDLYPSSEYSQTIIKQVPFKILQTKPAFLIQPPDTILDDYITIIPIIPI
jgi:hypothetical protein